MEFKAQPADAGSRLDVLVAAQYPQFTRSSLELLFDNELVSVNDKPAKASYKVKDLDSVSIDETLLNQEPPKIKLPVIYEDENVVVINKPAGLLTHAKGALNLEPSIASYIKSKISDNKLSGNRAGIVHRLDRLTSGVIITAKSSDAMIKLQKQFSQRKTKKKYIAVAEGVPEPQEAIIDVPIARNPKRPQTFAIMASGKTAVTKYKVIKQFSKKGVGYSLLELEPLTGRTHQLRVHLAYIGHPIVGDKVYGRQSGEMLLHAVSLEITLPGSERKVFESKMPERFKRFIDGE